MITPASDPNIQRVLNERAQALARPSLVETPGEMLELVVLALGPERYGVPAQQVQEIAELAGLTKVPGLPPFWAGLVNLHGRLYAVLDLRRYLGLPGTSPEGGGRVALVTAAGLSIALWVDDVLEVRDVPVTSLGPSLAQAPENLRLSGVRGVTTDLLAVLDLGALLADPRLVVQDEVR
jgi:purine-binding chemotaxis protein CheW